MNSVVLKAHKKVGRKVYVKVGKWGEKMVEPKECN
jgi:hypothetical protein